MSVHSRSLLFPRCPWMQHWLPPSQVRSGDDSPPYDRVRGEQGPSPAVWLCCPVGPFSWHETACYTERDEGQRHEDVFQFVSLVLSSVCLSCRRVMSDSHAAWHCRGRRQMGTVNGGKKRGKRQRRSAVIQEKGFLSNERRKLHVNTISEYTYSCLNCSAISVHNFFWFLCSMFYIFYLYIVFLFSIYFLCLCSVFIFSYFVLICIELF